MKNSDKILTFAAMFISCLALTVSIVQTRILQKQSQAAVWPRIDIWDSYGGDYYILEVVNQGVGPAIIKNIEYAFRDTVLYSVVDLIKYIGKQDRISRNGDDISINFGYSEIMKGRVIKPSEAIEIYNAKDSIGVRLGFEYFEELDIKIEYCSIYEHCWKFEDDHTIDLD
jgi:hypothetical protein